MHSLLVLSSLLLVLLGSYFALAFLNRIATQSRRHLQLIVLAGPVLSLAVGMGGLHHFVGRACFVVVPTWDYALGVALPLVMGIVAFIGLCLGLARLVLMRGVLVRRITLSADEDLQDAADRLAEKLGIPSPRILVCLHDHPLALTSGLWRPTVLLSTWMLDHLDQHELESVLAHELGHIARRDYLMVWIATLLRDAFFYMPTSWVAHRKLQREKELICDDVAVSLTSRPLTLASALAKVWYQAATGPGFSAAQPLVEARETTEMRIMRLLTGTQSSFSGASTSRLNFSALGLGAIGLVALMFVEAVNVALLLGPMGCGPGFGFTNWL